VCAPGLGWSRGAGGVTEGNRGQYGPRLHLTERVVRPSLSSRQPAPGGICRLLDDPLLAPALQTHVPQSVVPYYAVRFSASWLEPGPAAGDSQRRQDIGGHTLALTVTLAIALSRVPTRR
jgi:hypothetical protein